MAAAYCLPFLISENSGQNAYSIHPGGIFC